MTGTTGERAELDAGPTLLARVKAPRDVPVALGFGISTPEHAAAAAAAGADGVIVGSRLVRAAAEAARTCGRWSGPRGRARAGPTRRIPPRWGSFLTTCAGLVIWIVLWALGAKAFDAFLITILMVLVAGTVRIVTPYLPGNRAGPRRPRLNRARHGRTLGYGRVCLRSGAPP